VLYWFPREDGGDEPRLGLAVPKEMAQQSCEPDQTSITRGLALVFARGSAGTRLRADRAAGLAEASEQRGFEWLTERIGEVLQKAAA